MTWCNGVAFRNSIHDTLLKKALELLDNQETQELVREWFDVYMSVIDETSYLELSGKMDELETQINAAWGKDENFSS